MSTRPMPEYDPPPLDAERMQTIEGQREWLGEFIARFNHASFRLEMERREEEHMRQQNKLVRFVYRVFDPLLDDPLDIMFGPKGSSPRER